MPPCIWRIWPGQNYRTPIFLQAKMNGANLQHANLQRADLNLTNLYGANLSNANLSGASHPMVGP